MRPDPTPPGPGGAASGELLAFGSIATSGAVSGPWVEQAMGGVRGAAPFSTPYSLMYAERTWGEEGSMVSTASTPLAQSAAEVATSQPSFSSFLMRSGTTS